MSTAYTPRITTASCFPRALVALAGWPSGVVPVRSISFGFAASFSVTLKKLRSCPPATYTQRSPVTRTISGGPDVPPSVPSSRGTWISHSPCNRSRSFFGPRRAKYATAVATTMPTAASASSSGLGERRGVSPPVPGGGADTSPGG
ncbi:MAG TPA: hypothetical protein VMZ71_15840 [Gemmataceae bacterium]|nr:hypothetical protein [Gemmataceae bacterium]